MCNPIWGGCICQCSGQYSPGRTTLICYDLKIIHCYDSLKYNIRKLYGIIVIINIIFTFIVRFMIMLNITVVLIDCVIFYADTQNSSHNAWQNVTTLKLAIG